VSEDPITFQRETIEQFYQEALPLLHDHWREIARYQDIPLNVDLDRYRDAEENGSLRIYTVRLASRLVGYSVFFLATAPHYRTSLQAVQDVLYVDPEHRGGRIGLRLVRFSDLMLRNAENVQVVYHHVKLAHPALGRLLEHVGYEAVETVYGRRLG
jgi:GNAT superfamily N-acetyltransferase